MSFPQYPGYKDSGVKWLGEVPEHWEVMPLQRLVESDRPVMYGIVLPGPDVGAGVPVLKGGNVRPQRMKLSEVAFTTPEIEAPYARARLREGDLVYSIRGSIGDCEPVPKELAGANITQDVARIAIPNIDVPTFVRWALLSSPVREDLASGSLGAAVRGINIYDLKRARIPMPPRSERAVIADYLNTETSRIDVLVAEQERFIELLREKRQAVISHAVTKGLDPTVPMKDSGVEWLGIIPAHWGVCQSRRMFAVRSEPAQPSDRMLTASQKYGVLYQSDFVELEGRRVVEVIMGTESLKHVEPDDFIISMRSFQGGIEWCRLRGSTSFHYVMIKPVKWVHPPFFAHLLKSSTYIQALRATTDLIRDGQELRFSNFAQVDLPVVPLEEQAEIATVLTAETSRIDALITEVERAIILLQERRAALISAAVTGQIDVRGFTPEDAA